MTDIYNKLQKCLDEMPTGFPATESGIEIKILKQLFTEREADTFIRLGDKPISPEQACEKLDMDTTIIAPHLEKMAGKGLLLRLRKGENVLYKTVPYVMGIFEYQVESMEPSLAKDMEEYYQEAFGRTLLSYKTPMIRTIPIKTDIAGKWPVAPYEDIIKILENQKKITVANCVCRTVKHKIEKQCDKPLETCFIFGAHGDYYVENKMGRRIDIDEAIKIVKECDEKGLVMQPANSQKIGVVCCCCGCCCDMLRSLKMQPKPVSSVHSNYFAKIEEEECTACEICIDRCQMDAIKMEGNTVQIDLDRCIGCGLCVTGCPAGAAILVKKDEADQYMPPESSMGAYMEIAKERNIKR